MLLFLRLKMVVGGVQSGTAHLWLGNVCMPAELGIPPLAAIAGASAPRAVFLAQRPSCRAGI